MNDDNPALGKAAHKPVVMHPGPLSIEALLQYVDPVPDEEIERFVAAIFADRREAANTPFRPE